MVRKTAQLEKDAQKQQQCLESQNKFGILFARSGQVYLFICQALLPVKNGAESFEGKLISAPDSP